jgi:hypothetical protein
MYGRNKIAIILTADELIIRLSVCLIKIIFLISHIIQILHQM